MILLYDSEEQNFFHNGLGALVDAISCVAAPQELNGPYELLLKYPVTGLRYKDLALRRIILAPPDPMTRPQPFRIYRITEPLNGQISIYARHIAYDLQGIVVNPFSAPTAAAAMAGLKANASTTCLFDFDTDKSITSTMTVTTPTAIWSQLSGQEGSVLDVYGGEFEFDRFDVHLRTRRGADRGVRIAYGKNLTSYTQDKNCSNVWTGVYPYWQADDGTVTVLPEKIVNAPGSYDYTRILPLDVSLDFDEQPTEAQLRQRAETYIAANNIGVPDVSWTISFAQLEQSEEYRNSALLTRVQLGDTVHVDFPRYGVTASARVVAVKYNVLLNRYDSVTLGSVKANLAKTVATQEKEIERKPSRSLVENITNALTVGILGAKGGSIRILDTNNDGELDELYIADNKEPSLARRVWRWNYEGWAASSNGYNGEFIMGATLEKGILAAAVTAANLIAGTIQSTDGTTFYLDLDNGILNMDVNSLKLNGEDMSIIIQGVADDAADATAAVQSDVDDLRSHIVVGSDGSVTFIGASGNPITLKLTNNAVQILNSGVAIDTFGSGGTVTENLTIPNTGSLTMEPYKWISRSNGHLQLVFVG